MYHSDWFKLRYELTRDYPNRTYDIGSIHEATSFEGNIYIGTGNFKIYPENYKDHFKKLRWWEYRTIEQLQSIKYMKVVSGSDYYGVGDIVEVLCFMYNNPTIVGGRDNILFNLKGHFFNVTQLQPATKDEHDQFWDKNKLK